MKSLDRNLLEEQIRLVSRYVAGDLSRSERAEFEAWLVASPELAAEVELERRLRRGMASAARRGWLPRDAVTPRPARPRHWQLGIAASVLVVIAAGVSVMLPDRDDTSVVASSSSAPGMPMVVRLGKVRSVSAVPDITLNRDKLPSQLIVEPDVVVLTCPNGAIELECAGGMSPQTPQYPEYEVDLVNRRGSTLAWRSARQQPVMRTQLAFTLRDPAILEAGDYDLIVRGVSPEHEEVVGRFWLTVTK